MRILPNLSSGRIFANIWKFGRPTSLPITMALLFTVFPITAQAAPPAEMENTMNQQTSQFLLTILTSDDPQTQLMALTLTDAAVQKGAHARILLCSGAGDVALKVPPENAAAPLAPKGMSPHKLLQKLMQTGATVDVCAIYLPNRSFDKTALLDGVGVATPSIVVDYMMQNNVRQLSF